MQKKYKNIDKETIIKAINDKFGTQRECAKALGIEESNLSNKLKRLSTKFIFQLKNIGVQLPPIDYGFTLQITNPYIKEPDSRYDNFVKEIEQLKNELGEAKKLQTFLVNKVTEIEEENKNLRAGSAALLKNNSGKSGGKIKNKF